MSQDATGAWKWRLGYIVLIGANIVAACWLWRVVTQAMGMT